MGSICKSPLKNRIKTIPKTSKSYDMQRHLSVTPSMSNEYTIISKGINKVIKPCGVTTTTAKAYQKTDPCLSLMEIPRDGFGFGRNIQY